MSVTLGNPLPITVPGPFNSPYSSQIDRRSRRHCGEVAALDRGVYLGTLCFVLSHLSENETSKVHVEDQKYRLPWGRKFPPLVLSIKYIGSGALGTILDVRSWLSATKQ